jgi:voltage-gated potassium channel
VPRNPLIWVGLAGVERDDDARAYFWQQRLRWVMVGVALLALPGYLLDNAQHSTLQRIATLLDALIFCAFLAETVWMAHLSSHPAHYLVANWLNLVILVGTFASVLGATTEWIALVRILRVAVSGLLLARTLARFGVLFTRRGAPLLVGTAVLIMLATGGMFYWLEPTINNYWDGLWLAFVTGSTVGYGDVVPTSGASRMLAVITTLIGVSLVALFTANIVSFFVGHEERQFRRDLRRDVAELQDQIVGLRGDVANLRTEFAKREGSQPVDLNRG